MLLEIAREHPPGIRRSDTYYTGSSLLSHGDLVAVNSRRGVHMKWVEVGDASHLRVGRDSRSGIAVHIALMGVALLNIPQCHLGHVSFEQCLH